MDAADRERLEAVKADSVVQRLFRVARRLDDHARGLASEASGHPLRAAHTRLLPHVDLEGTRLTEIAQRLGVAKQSVAPAVDDLVSWGVLEKVADPADGRARLVRFTGVEPLLEGLAVLGAVEVDLAAATGAARVGEVKRWLADVEVWLDGAQGSEAHPRGPS